MYPMSSLASQPNPKRGVSGSVRNKNKGQPDAQPVAVPDTWVPYSGKRTSPFKLSYDVHAPWHMCPHTLINFNAFFLSNIRWSLTEEDIGILVSTCTHARACTHAGACTHIPYRLMYSQTQLYNIHSHTDRYMELQCTCTCSTSLTYTHAYTGV